ncbi:TetR/AcrR family transcriptional regulator [Methylocella silvestris]|uniref:TetR family transcriptional regulator n=1 Tax=Methylocella silvestris TaxID=199596 RepID=A0A2J7THD0_METSI|nr:TetR/AcrR family transcriptional regulator [Methylocella silvestris]PNG26159.1 TetR family transcriptional regulator [Methylocella silvestris]
MQQKPVRPRPTDAQCARAQVKIVPRGEKRRDEIAAVAEAVFLDAGYADTTMQIIAARAGASKETLYRHFGCKADLFAEVVRRRSALVAGAEDNLRGAPQQALLRFSLNFLEFLTRPDSVCLYRVVVAEAPREPELGRIFFDQGPGRLLLRLAAYMKSAAEAGELSCADPTLAARLFLGSVISYYQLSVLTGGRAFGKDDILAHAQGAVSLFMARYGSKS